MGNSPSTNLTEAQTGCRDGLGATAKKNCEEKNENIRNLFVIYLKTPFVNREKERRVVG
jgi:hypothetical protein